MFKAFHSGIAVCATYAVRARRSLSLSETGGDSAGEKRGWRPMSTPVSSARTRGVQWSAETTRASRPASRMNGSAPPLKSGIAPSSDACREKSGDAEIRRECAWVRELYRAVQCRAVPRVPNVSIPAALA